MDPHPLQVLATTHPLQRGQIHGDPQITGLDFRHLAPAKKIIKPMDGTAQWTTLKPTASPKHLQSLRVAAQARLEPWHSIEKSGEPPHGTAPRPVPDRFRTATIPPGLLQSAPSILSARRQACLKT